jgi:two-component system, OmpR family, phosphate regulon sensor histidine kinase PhoR
MDIWLLVLIIFIATIIVIYIAASAFGYRLVRKKKRGTKTDTRPLEDALAASQAARRAAALALSEIEDGVLITDSGYLVQYANNAAGRMFDLLPDRCNGLTFIEVVRDHECDELLKKCVISNEPQSALIKTHLKKQLLDVAASPEAETGNYVVIVRDLTERQRIEQMRRDLVSNIAHEFRTPIASIRLLTETLLHGKVDDPKVTADFLGKIDLESSRLEQMTKDVNDLSLLDRGELITRKTAVDVGRLIKQTIGRLKAQADQKQIAVETIIEDGLPHPVIDRGGIESVLMNLVYNAIKYSGQGGRVVVEAAKDGGNILVSIKDNGVGIPKDELPRIFERFYKVDKSRNTEGSGLGLAISKHVIALHWGRIWVDSMEGKGATFYFTLPLNHE